MVITVAEGLLIPLLGTSLGAMCVLFMKKEMSDTIRKSLTGFAAGVMIAASVWSLLIPSMEMSESMGKLSFIPAVIGFVIGILFLLALDTFVPHMHFDNIEEGPKSSLQKTTMLLLAVTIHNIPEGMAVGVVYAGMVTGGASITASAALALAIGIAIQNFPEGAIISMPLAAHGIKKSKACLMGILSGVVEPIAGLVTILLMNIAVPVLPYLLSFAAGAMFYVVIEELIPEMSEGKHSNVGTIMFTIGFCLMMMLDVALG